MQFSNEYRLNQYGSNEAAFTIKTFDEEIIKEYDL